MANTADEGASKITVKNRLVAAARAAGITIRFRRSDETSVIFEVASRETEPVAKAPYTGKPRGRKPTTAA